MAFFSLVASRFLFVLKEFPFLGVPYPFKWRSVLPSLFYGGSSLSHTTAINVILLFLIPTFTRHHLLLSYFNFYLFFMLFIRQSSKTLMPDHWQRKHNQAETLEIIPLAFIDMRIRFWPRNLRIKWCSHVEPSSVEKPAFLCLPATPPECACRSSACQNRVAIPPSLSTYCGLVVSAYVDPSLMLLSIYNKINI